MSIKCRHCGKTGFPPSYMSCPYCGYPLTTPSNSPAEAWTTKDVNYKINDTTMPTFEKTQSVNKDLEIVKGTVMWCLNPGEIARRININEFDNLSEANGVYVQEGVIAVLMIDGKITAQLSSGVYYFETKTERFIGALRNIWRFFSGKKQNGSANEDELRRGRLGSVLQNLGESSFVDVALVTDGVIPLVFGINSVNEGGFVFWPFTIKTKLENVKVALSLQLVISDFSAFRKNYLTKQSFFRIADLQVILQGPIYNYLQEVLAYETIESPVLSPRLKERIRQGLSEKLNAILYGISVYQVIDISIDSNDFERFRELEHKLYCTNKLLDYLIRTNDFKNRLATETNSQKVREARSEEDLRHALQLLNKDALLHDDEIEEFCQLLANQKAIREAQTDEDREKALTNINKSKLIREDEFDDLLHELKKHQDSRDEIDVILHWQRYRRTNKESISALTDIELLTADSKKAIEQAQFEAAKQQQSHDHELDRASFTFQIEKNDAARGERKKEDDYGDYRRDEGHRRDISEDRDWANNVDYEENLHIARIKKIQDISLASMNTMREQDRTDNAQYIAHKETLTRIEHDTQRALIDAQKGMSPAQIAAMNLSEMPEAAQIAFASSLQSSIEGEYLKKTAEKEVEMMQEVVKQTRDLEKENRERYERAYDKMMSFASDAMKTNASIAAGSTAERRDSVENTLKTVKDIATHRQDEVDSDRREAKNDARHAQSRLDHTQDTALHYTTKFASTESIADAMKGDEGKSDSIFRYKIMSMGSRLYQLGEIYAMIQQGIVGPDTNIMINGIIYKAYDCPEMKDLIDKTYSVECPNCGATGLRGHLCPECKKQL